MTQVSFYHLQRQPLEIALPKLLERVQASGARAVVKPKDRDQLDKLDEALWTYDADSFLAHGRADGPHAGEQPILLTLQDEVPNGAPVLVLAGNAEHGALASFERVLYMFEGADEASLATARAHYKQFKEAGHTLAYYQQSDAGKWEKKA